MKVYAGIGSRRTPENILGVMRQVSLALREDGWWLRSGHAEGADQAFEVGAGNAADIFLPWPSFNDDVPIEGTIFEGPTLSAQKLTSRHHPFWEPLPFAVKKLHARNAHQVLGWDLASPARFVVCWTPDGSLDGTGPNTGGTGQALRIAAAHGIEVFNLKRDDHLERITSYLARWAPALP